jgi:ABC-type branched-subunit amino acid transport system ATPase component
LDLAVANALVVRGLSKSFGGVRAVNRVDLEIATGHVHSLIGPNGAGKTTAFNCISGFLRPESGQVLLDGRDVTGWKPHRLVTAGMARTFQVTRIFGELTVLENVALAARSRSNRNLLMWRSAESFPSERSEALSVLETLGLGDYAGVTGDHLSHGDKRVLEIAIALALRPKILMLDEPTAGMSGGESERIAMLISSFAVQATVLLVEHDIDIVLGISNAVTVIDQGSVIATGSPSEISSNSKVQEAYLGRKLENS